MPFVTTKWFPFTVGFAVLALVIALGASGLASPKICCCLAVFDMGFVLDGCAGVHALPLLAIKSPKQQTSLTEQIFYSRTYAAPRYVLDIVLGAIFLAVAFFVKSDTAIGIALVFCVVIYGVFSAVGLFRAFGEAGNRLGSAVT